MHRVVIVGSGFGGLFAAKALRDEPVQVTIVARTTHHLFQPLLYQVATGVLSAGEIAPTTREVLRRQRNAEVLLGDVESIDVAGRSVTAATPDGPLVLGYDSLIVAAGTGQSYFGNDHFAPHAPGMKTIADAVEIRSRILGAFELAELAARSSGGSPAGTEAIRRYLTFVVIGAGPTGVEMAGQIAELAHRALRHEFRSISPADARIVVLDAGSILTAFDPALGQKAKRKLESMGVEVRLGVKVIGVDADGVEVEESDGTRARIPAQCKIWAAGVAASPLGQHLARQTGAETDRAGRIKVLPDLSLPGHPEVFVVGDLISLDNLPGVAQVAMQSGRHAAHQIARRLSAGSPGQPFHYVDKGSMAIVSRFYAVANIWGRNLSGPPAWVVWLFVHLLYLIGFKNRVTTLFRWAVSFVGRSPSARTLLVGDLASARADPSRKT